ncbi:hypothetical protein [Pseudoxanthomonas sp. X-1]|uniref:hypothetical protein n=1 Tax=Pseudoxanthomonas sp. X-1 TaxID=2571115 RepID=UPI00110BA04D|nr:hypothetical protein [Pseudoxanthomonas sp. X-1]TMN24511.1 hypothetical protein FF950_05365 [Pseudoxanthomonas sp. X-1]UAY75223.1 hypothetical protein LAJ50_02865 [Pseudoxanthomonas sp. X-1]
MKKPPKVRLRDNEPLQDYYQDRDGARYAVARLLDDAKDLPVFEVPLAGLNLSSEPWNGENMRGLAHHVRACMNADLSYPILLDWNGAIADGRHRVLKAIALGKRTIKARRMHWKPVPDREAP